MKYSEQIIIELPREEVVRKWEDQDNFKYWQKGYISYRLLSGKKGEEGARAKLKYRMGNREIEMIETITKRVFPKKVHAIYEAKGVYNVQKHYFEEEPNTFTLWISDTEFKFSGFIKIIGFLTRKSFRKQTRQYMENFKAFAEKGESIQKNK